MTTQDLPTPAVTAAQELKAAATKLRETATKATPGRWFVLETDKDDHELNGLFWIHSDTHGAVTGDMSEGGVFIERSGTEGGQHDAAWIALASPALAEPLAAWLTEFAEWHEASLGEEEHDGCEMPLAECTCFDHALAVARAINGRKP